MSEVEEAIQARMDKRDKLNEIIRGGGDDLTDAQQEKMLKKRDGYDKDINARGRTIEDLRKDLGFAEKNLSNVKKKLSSTGALGMRSVSEADMKKVKDVMRPLDDIPKSIKMKEEIKAILNSSYESLTTDGYLTVRSKMRMKEALGDKYQDWEDQLYLLRDNGTYRKKDFNTPIDLMDKARKSKLRGASSKLLAGTAGLGLGIRAINEKNKKESK